MIAIALNLIEKHHLKLSKTNAMLMSIAITIVVMILELIYGIVANSLMLFSDGLHMFSHAASLGISLTAIHLAKIPKFHKAESWAALFNGFGLLFFTAFILLESYYRFMSPETIETNATFFVAILGLIVNLATAVILACSGVEDLNTKSAFLHMLADTFSSVAIIVGTIIIIYTDWFWIDAILSAVVALVVGKWSIGLLRSALLDLYKEASPRGQ